MQIIRLQVSVFLYLWSYGFVSVGCNISYNPLMSSIIYIWRAEWRPSRCMAINWTRKIRVERHVSLNDLASIVYRELDDDTSREIQGVIIQGLTGELTTRAVHDNRQFHLRTSSLLTVGDLYNVISSLDRGWRVKYGLTVVWPIPATPNFVRFITRNGTRRRNI